jgi:hypothetical protein
LPRVFLPSKGFKELFSQAVCLHGKDKTFLHLHMDFIKLSAAINGLGLILDMIGVILMFKKEDVTTYMYTRAEIAGVNKKKNRRPNVGLWFLITGFFLQLVALFF